MRTSLLTPLSLLLIGSTVLSNPMPDPQPTLSWADKIHAMAKYLRGLPICTDNAGWGHPAYQVTFEDGDCHQVRIYNWECTISVPYNLSVIADWLEKGDFSTWNRTRFEDTRTSFWVGWYRDPVDGFAFYDVARFTWGACGNRGPQSACGHVYCTDKNGNTVGGPGTVPAGENPWLDPNDRNRLCPWLR